MKICLKEAAWFFISAKFLSLDFILYQTNFETSRTKIQRFRESNRTHKSNKFAGNIINIHTSRRFGGGDTRISPGRPSKIIFALLRCSLQSFGEYLKRPDQSLSGQFHQHLNTTSFRFLLLPLAFAFLPFYLLLPGKGGNETSPSPLRLFARAAKRAEKRGTRENEPSQGQQTGERRETYIYFSIYLSIYIYIYIYM